MIQSPKVTVPQSSVTVNPQQLCHSFFNSVDTKLKILNILLTFFGSRLCVCAYVRLFKKEGGNISVGMSLFVLLHNTHFMNKLQFNDFLTINNQQ